MLNDTCSQRYVSGKEEATFLVSFEKLSLLFKVCIFSTGFMKYLNMEKMLKGYGIILTRVGNFRVSVVKHQLH